MQSQGSGVASESFDLLHPDRIVDPTRVEALLGEALAQEIPLLRGMNRKIDPETAWIERLEADRILIRTKNFEFDNRRQIFLRFLLGGQPHFFAAELIEKKEEGGAWLQLPSVVYLAERRDHHRRPPEPGDCRRVALSSRDGDAAEGEVEDLCAEGMGVVVPEEAAGRLDEHVSVQLIDGSLAGTRLHGEVRQRSRAPKGDGWTRIGLGLSATRPGERVQRESARSGGGGSVADSAQRRWKVLAAAVQVATNRVRENVFRTRFLLPEIRVIDYANEHGERIRGIVDSWGDTRGATAVVMPPAWGRTKETLMPLAACIVAGFRAAGEPVVVVRFDGIRKRGESYNDPGCSDPRKDHHRFTFSQGYRDIRTTLDYLEKNPEFMPRSTILVSFSAAAIEARRAVASDRRIDGWVSVVGAADLQSMMRVISGGVDYALGLERGLRFGMQEILGIEVDMDHAGLDAFEHSLVYLEDSRRDMAAIRTPITWIHGKFDAWMNADRALDALSRGDTANRRFIEVPTGHMLKTSSEALDTFQLVVAEVARMALGRSVKPTLPDLGGLELRRRAERSRLSKRAPDLRSFWKDYLLGRDETLGIELMTSITPYRELMRRQVEALELSPESRVADLGSGTGAFLLHLLDEGRVVPARVFELDYVRAGLLRARSECGKRVAPGGLEISFLACDLATGRGAPLVPLADRSVDAALAGLLISYVPDPSRLLAEAQRILKPGGRLVVSSLRRDADMSRLYRDGVAELREGRAREALGESGAERIDELARGYLNQASRLLDFEEEGIFRFWDPPELVDLVKSAGFVRVTSQRSLGTPPQAVIVSAVRR